MKTNLLSRFKRTFKDSSIYALSSLLNSGISFLLLPVLTFYYDANEYGTYSLIMTIVVILGGLFYFGASSSYARFIYDQESKEHKIKIFSRTVNLSLVGGMTMILITIIFGKNLSYFLFESSDYFLHILLASISSVFGFFVSILHVVFQFDKSPIKLLIISFIGITLNFLITYILLVYYDYGILAPILGILSCNILITFYLIYYYAKFYSLRIKINFDSNFLRFGLQSSIGGILFYLVDYSDRIMINRILSTDEVGIYSLGYKLGFIINIILVIPFSQAWAPIKMEFINDNRQNEFTSNIISYYFLIGILLIFISTLFGSNFFDLVFVNRDFEGYLKIFPVIMSSIFLYGTINMTNIGLYKEVKLKYQNIVMLLALIINILINILFLNKYGILIAAYSTLVTYALIAFAVTIISNKFLFIKIEKLRVISLLIVMISFLLINSFTEIIINLSFSHKLLILSLFLISIYSIWLNKKEKYIINKLVTRSL